MTSADPLAEITAARRALADRLVSPWWVHPAVGVVLAGFQLAVLTLSPLVIGVAVPSAAIGMAVLYRADRVPTGVRHRDPGGRTRPWLVGMYLVGLCVSAAIRLTTLLWWPSVLIALGIVLAFTVLGRGYDAALRSLPREQP